MQGAILYGARDVRFEDLPAPQITAPTDAVIRLSATCICGSDLWPYRGLQAVARPTPMGHEYCGIVEEVGKGVTSVTPGQFVIGSFFASEVFDLRRLSTAGTPPGMDPEVGDLAYYAPWGNLAIYYRDFGYSEGLVKLGHIDSGIESLGRTRGEFVLRFELAEAQ